MNAGIKQVIYNNRNQLPVAAIASYQLLQTIKTKEVIILVKPGARVRNSRSSRQNARPAGQTFKRISYFDSGGIASRCA